jgi:hypothetical protein
MREDEGADEQALQRLLAGLPPLVARTIRALLRPDAWWLRIPVALTLIAGGVMGFLPLLGFWMLPLGVLLLPKDIPL